MPQQGGADRFDGRGCSGQRGAGLFQEAAGGGGVVVSESRDGVRRPCGGGRGGLGQLAQEGDGLAAVEGGRRVAQRRLGEQLAAEQRSPVQGAADPHHLLQLSLARAARLLEVVEPVRGIEQQVGEEQQFLVTRAEGEGLGQGVSWARGRRMPDGAGAGDGAAHLGDGPQ